MIYIILIGILLVLSVIDEKSRIVPEGLSLLIIIIGLNWHALHGTANMSIIGMTAGVASVWAVSSSPAVKLGGGDAKVIGIIGTWLGWQAALITLTLSIAIYKAFFSQKKPIPFVPIILEGFIIVSIGTGLCQIAKLFLRM